MAPATIKVDTYSIHGNTEVPLRFHLGERTVDVAETVDQWYGNRYRYVMLRSQSNDIYILRFDELRGTWELTMYKSPRADAYFPAFADQTGRRGYIFEETESRAPAPRRH